MIFFLFFFSLSLSLFQVLGKPKPFLGFGVPLVSLHLGHALRLPPVHHARHLHLGLAPAPVFLFFSSSSFAGLGLGLFGLSLFGGCFLGGGSLRC